VTTVCFTGAVGEVLPIPEEDSDDSGGQTVSAREKCGGKPIPVAYQLPDFGFRLNLVLSKRRPVTMSVKGEIVSKLFEDMLRYCKDL
jgi:hypothetical protein